MLLLRNMSFDEFNKFIEGQTIEGRCRSHTKIDGFLEEGLYVYFYEYEGIFKDIQRVWENWRVNDAACIFEYTGTVKRTTSYSAWDEVEETQAVLLPYYNNRSVRLLDVIFNKQ